MEGFPESVIDAVDAMTKNDGETYFSFIHRVALNEIAVDVKIADLTDNMSDLNEGSMKDKYRFARMMLRIVDDWNPTMLADYDY